MFAHIYVLTGRNLVKADGSRGAVNPYLQVVGGKTTLTSEKRFSNTNNPDFYEHFVIPVNVPGHDTVTIEVWNKGVFGLGDSQIGKSSHSQLLMLYFFDSNGARYFSLLLRNTLLH